MKNLTTQLAGMKEILEDPEQTSIRLVINPEKMVIKEAQRAYTFFCLFGYSVDLVIVNRVLPREVGDPYFKNWKTIQEGYIHQVEESFSPLPIFTAELYQQEIVGLDLLATIGKSVYREADPAALFFRQSPMRIEALDGKFILTLYLPFAERGELDLLQKGEELFVRVGHLKRNILLPRILLSHAVQSARFEKNELKITFQ